MKVSLNWLKELVEINTSPEALSEKLSIGGFEVESLIDTSSKVKGVVLGKVLSVEKHQNANKLSICKVDIGNKKILQIICGAKNIRSDIYVYVATVGSFLPSINLSIKKNEIRGILSEGMICSLEELGLEAKSEGIAIIEKKDKSYILGKPISELLGLDDFVYDLAITANRPDGMSVIGIAREISALLKTDLTHPKNNQDLEVNLFKPSVLCNSAINSDSIYTISFINNIDGKLLSPSWLRDRLEKSEIKSINLIVDITNYILLEQGQPLHAFDKDKLINLIGRKVEPTDFGVRKALHGEELLALDGNKYELNEKITIITCSDKPIAIAGVIGGLDTSVTETTKSIVLEAAVFSSTEIRKSSRELGIRTESSSRFEKGISIQNTLPSLNRTLTLMKMFFVALDQTFYSCKNIIKEDLPIILRRSSIHKILGPIISYKDKNTLQKRNLEDYEIRDKLNLIGCTLQEKDYGWDVIVLPNRSQDLIREIDLIEEIARLIGYDLFDQNLPSPIRPGKLTNSQLALRKLRNSFTILGFNEVLTYSLVADENNERIKISNPLLAETSCLRNNIWEEHLKICNQNIKAGRESCWIFEIGNIFNKDNDFKQDQIVSGAIFGINNFESWHIPERNTQINYYQARGKLREVFSSLNIEIIDKSTGKYKFLHPGRSSILIIEGKESGFFGEIHPKLINEKKALSKIYIFKLNINSIIEASTRKNKWVAIYKKYPTVPKIDRDINFIFNKKHDLGEILLFIKKQGKSILEEVKLIDVYEDKILEDNNISYTFRLSYRDKEKTLKETDISHINENIIKNIENRYSTKLR